MRNPPAVQSRSDRVVHGHDRGGDVVAVAPPSEPLRRSRRPGLCHDEFTLESRRETGAGSRRHERAGGPRSGQRHGTRARPSGRWGLGPAKRRPAFARWRRRLSRRPAGAGPGGDRVPAQPPRTRAHPRRRGAAAPPRQRVLRRRHRVRKTDRRGGSLGRIQIFGISRACFQQSSLRGRSHRRLRRTHGAEAEDIAQSCSIDFEELPAIWDIDVALAAGATPIHDGWTDNIFAQTRIETGDLEAVRASTATS